MLPNLSNLSLSTGVDSTEATPYEKALEQRKESVRRRQADARLQRLSQQRSEPPGATVEMTDTLGTREQLTTVTSDNLEHARVLSVLCYTRGWDGIINAVLKTAKSDSPLTPSKALRQESDAKGYVSAKLNVLPFFIDAGTEVANAFKDYLKADMDSMHRAGVGQRLVMFDDSLKPQNMVFKLDARDYCGSDDSSAIVSTSGPSTFTIFTSGAEAREVLGDGPFEHVSGSGMKWNYLAQNDEGLSEVVAHRVRELIFDLRRSYSVDTQRVELAMRVFDGVVYRLIKHLSSCFYPLNAWAQMPCARNENMGTGKNGSSVRFRGQMVHKGGNAINPRRMNSTTAHWDAAVRFALGKEDSTIFVLFLEPTCRVLDIRTFFGQENKGLVCFDEECETLIDASQEWLEISRADAEILGDPSKSLGFLKPPLGEREDWKVGAGVYALKTELRARPVQLAFYKVSAPTSPVYSTTSPAYKPRVNVE